MDIRKINERISVSSQIGVDDVASLAALGFRTVINNRPDGESPDQPAEADIAAAAAEAGLEFLSLPVVSGMVSPAQLDAFRSAYDAADGPILAYCRSGMRSTCVWAIAMSPELGVDEAVDMAASAGYDLSGLRPILG